MDELEAIQASRAGDKTAFSVLIEQYYEIFIVMLSVCR